MDRFLGKRGREELRHLSTECLRNYALKERYTIRMPTSQGSCTVFDQEGFMHDFVFTPMARELAVQLELPLYEFDDPLQPTGHGYRTIEQVVREPVAMKKNALDYRALAEGVGHEIKEGYFLNPPCEGVSYWTNLSTLTGVREKQRVSENRISNSSYFADGGAMDIESAHFELGITDEEMGALEQVVHLFERTLEGKREDFARDAPEVFSQVFPRLYTPFFDTPGVYVGARDVNIVFEDIGEDTPGELDTVRDICLRHQKETMVPEYAKALVDAGDGLLFPAPEKDRVRGYELYRPAADAQMSFQRIGRALYELWNGG